jgi:hypothetical protein
MKRIIIIIISVVSVLAIAFILLLGFFEGGLFFMAPSYNKMDRFLTANIEELSFVSNFLFELDCDYIEIRKSPIRSEEQYNMTVRNGNESELIPIPAELLNHVKRLYERGVKIISCGRDSIGFITWTTMSESRGMIFSRTGETPDGGQLIEVRQLSRQNWHYYVNNFEKWKARNPHLFP